MKKLNLLFLGGGKRVAIGRMFLQAARQAGVEASITGYEADTQVPLAQIGDIIVGLPWRDPALAANLEKLVIERDIHAVIPFVDHAVGIAARLGKHFGGDVFVPAPTYDVCSCMFDKILAAEAFERAGLPIPATYRPGDQCTRLIAKPRYGSASKGLVMIDNLQKLYEIQSVGDRYLIQERIDNRQEITVDCYVSLCGAGICAVSPRIRLEVSGGEAVRTVTVDDPEAVALARQTLLSLKLVGAVTVQLIRDLSNGRLMVMEVNPRLGGGAVCSVHAGADIPRMIVDETLGLAATPSTPVAGVLTARYLEDVVFKP